ncbi:MAG: single-stranded DNA-binding protein [Patescibacteria group bacterium]
MLNLNRAQILGNLTRDAEMRFTPNGQPVSSFTVATNRRWKGKDGAAGGEATEYHDIVLWGQQAETLSPMLKKGGPVFVEGRLQTRSWEGQDGVKRFKTEIVAENVIVLGGRGGSAPSTMSDSNPVDTTSESQEPAAKKQSDDEIDIDEIPF